jgi:hypothetical protein
MWQFMQTSGNFMHDGVLVAQGYSGHGAGMNNPRMQSIEDIGVLPRGIYTIGDPKDPPDFLGPLAMPLTPDPTNQMFGRGSFFIHGDNAQMNHTASDGCIILAHDIRQMIADSTDRQLTVTA